MTVSEDAILEKLKNVIDPELFVNIVDLGLIYEIKIGADAADAPAPATATSDDGEKKDAAEVPAADAPQDADGEPILIEMTMTSPACPAGPQLIGGAKKEVSGLDGVGNVEVKIVLDPPWTPDRMTEDAKDQLGIF